MVQHQSAFGVGLHPVRFVTPPWIHKKVCFRFFLCVVGNVVKVVKLGNGQERFLSLW